MKQVYEGDLLKIFRFSDQVYLRQGDLMQRGQCNSAYLVGESGVVVVDIPTMEALVEMQSEVLGLFKKPIRAVIATHGHGDHVDGIVGFAGTAIQVFCSHKLTAKLCGMLGEQAQVCGIKGQARLHICGMEIELFTFEDIAHSPEDLFVRIPGEKLLCTGDAVVDLQWLHFHSGNAERWAVNLETFAKSGQQEQIWPGHGELLPFHHVGETAAHIGRLMYAAKSCMAALPNGQAQDLNREDLDRLVADFLKSGSVDAVEIAQKAREGAHRELRMVLRELLRQNLQ
ncbi:MBL fold metallo-hydrolase [Lachnospiraceae bacterium ZAX-1]